MVKKEQAVTSEIPKEWTPEQQTIAKEALRILNWHYPGWKWAAQFSKTIEGRNEIQDRPCLIIRLMDLPTQTVYVINPKDIDLDRMTCAIRAGGMLLEAHGLPVGAAQRNDKVRYLRRTPGGIILPDVNAVPENNPGYLTIKNQTRLLQ